MLAILLIFNFRIDFICFFRIFNCKFIIVKFILGSLSFLLACLISWMNILPIKLFIICIFDWLGLLFGHFLIKNTIFGIYNLKILLWYFENSSISFYHLHIFLWQGFQARVQWHETNYRIFSCLLSQLHLCQTINETVQIFDVVMCLDSAILLRLSVLIIRCQLLLHAINKLLKILKLFLKSCLFFIFFHWVLLQDFITFHCSHFQRFWLLYDEFIF